MQKKELLSNLFDITAGGDIKKEQYSISKKGKYKYPVYSNQLTDRGLFGYYDNYNVDYNSITVTARGTIGHAEARINEKYKPIGRLLVLKPKVNINLEYIKNVINYKIKFANESTGVPQLTAPQIGKYIIGFTENIKEQEGIANILTNIDNLIDSLQRTIKKKEKIKISTIQKYLTGRERLKKYTSKWLKGTIEDISTEIVKGNGLSKEILEINGSNKCILYGELFTVYNELIESVVSRTNINSSIYSKKGDILIPCSTTTVGKDLAKACVINEDDVLLGGDINIIRVKNNISPLFIAYLFSNILYKEVEKVAQGTTIIHLHGKNIAKIPIFIPSEYEEQEELVKILIKMDEELNLLNKKLEKYKQIKEGMMEDLLTGKVRLNYE